MRSIKREARGISPIIATILLIAVTAVAAGVIAAYVGGLYVTTPRLVSARATGAVFDKEPGVLENYIDGDATVSVVLTGASMRDASDPTRGFSVLLRNPRTGFVMTLIPTLANQYNTYITAENSLTLSGQTVIGRLRYFVDAGRDVPSGSSITVDLDVTADNAAFEWWRERDTIEITVSARDSLSLLGYDGAYLTTRPLA